MEFRIYAPSARCGCRIDIGHSTVFSMTAFGRLESRPAPFGYNACVRWSGRKTSTSIPCSGREKPEVRARAAPAMHAARLPVPVHLLEQANVPRWFEPRDDLPAQRHTHGRGRDIPSAHAPGRTIPDDTYREDAADAEHNRLHQVRSIVLAGTRSPPLVD